MLGLRQDADQYLQQARNEHGFKKSYRFAERLNGRFFVSGISGGFEKFNKLKHANDLAPAPEKKPKYDYQPVLEKAQREELRREAEKLLELEEKLAEIQRIKEAKRRRDRQRQMRKLQFQSASCIQRFWRKTIRLRREGAANLLVKFLKAQKARQAVYTAAWAASVLKKFAIQASRRWRRWKFFQRQVKRIAAKNWYLVQEVACLWTQARRDVTDQFVHHVIQSAMKNAKRELMAKMGKVRRNSVAVKREPSSYFAFFLTEGSQADSATHDDDHNGDDDSEYEDALATNNLSPNAFMRRQQARYLKYLKSYEGQSPPEKKKVYDFNDHRVKILVKKHQDVLKKMDDEEAARLERVERLRKKAQEEAESQKQAKERQRKEKERQKAALQRKQEEEHQEKLRQFQRQREKRLKQEEARKKDEKRQEAERKLMRLEDPLVLAKRMRDWQLHVQQLKKAKEAKLLQEQQQHPQLKRPPDDRPLHHNPTPDELAQTEERRKAQEAEEARVREAIRQRIREKMQTLAQEKKQKELEEKEKKEKLDQFMGAYQEQLQRQKEEFLKKQREKDRQRKAEEKRLKQAEKAKEQALIDAILREQEAKDAEDRAHWQALPESDRRVIASAQEYDDQMPLEDFGFDDFIRKSLTKVYSRPPPSLTAAGTTTTSPTAAGAGAGAPPKWIPTSPEEEQKLQTIKAKVVKTVIKKIPASLRNTPYFKHYFKHTVVNRLLERGLASADDEALLHRQTEELLVQLHKQQAILNDDAEDADSTVVAKATAAALLTQPSAKWDVATAAGNATAAAAAVGAKEKSAAAAVSAIDTSALAPRGSFAQQPVAPTPTMPAPLSKSRSAGQLVVPGSSTAAVAATGAAASTVAVGLRGVKARKLQKEHAHGSTTAAAPAAAASAAAAAAAVNDTAATVAATDDNDGTGDPEDNEDLMALIARAKQRLLQPAPPVKTTAMAAAAMAVTHEALPPAAIQTTSTALHTSQSQPVLSSLGPPPLNGYESTAIALAPKAAATPKPLASSSSSSSVAMPKMPSVQEFLRMQPGPPSLPGAPPSLDNIASRYPLTWDVPGATSMSGLPAGAAGAAAAASSSALALPVKKKAKANGKAAVAGGKPPHGATAAAAAALMGPSLPTKKAQKKPSQEPPVAGASTAATDMSDKELRARERQIRARRKHGPAIKLKPRSPSTTTDPSATATAAANSSSSNQLSPSHDLAFDESDADSTDANDVDEGEGEDEGDGDGAGDGDGEAAAVAGSLDDYAFATATDEYRERPDALITDKVDDADDDYGDYGDDVDSDDGDDRRARERSREATHSAGSQRSAGGSRVRSKLHAYEDYEEKLQADYLALRRQFQAKLKAATEEYHGHHSSGDGDGDGVGAPQQTSVSPSSRFNRRSDDGGDGEDDSVLTRSVTDLYVAMGDGTSASSAGGGKGSGAEEDTAAAAAASAAAVAAAEEEERRMREQLQVTTKDLLRSWALEDEMEARRDAALRRAADGGDGDADGDEDADGEGDYHRGQPMAMDDEAAAEYVAWLRSRGELPSDDDGDDAEEESEEEFDPIQAHMAQRRREVAAARQEIRRSSAGTTATAASATATAAAVPVIKSRGGHRSAAVATVNEDEDDDGDDDDDEEEEDEDDDSAVLFDEEKALLLAERRQRRRQQELAAMKQRETEKKKFWEALINT